MFGSLLMIGDCDESITSGRGDYTSLTEFRREAVQNVPPVQILLLPVWSLAIPFWYSQGALTWQIQPIRCSNRSLHIFHKRRKEIEINMCGRSSGSISSVLINCFCYEVLLCSLELLQILFFANLVSQPPFNYSSA